jgi:hypothetical protein
MEESEIKKTSPAQCLSPENPYRNNTRPTQITPVAQGISIHGWHKRQQIRPCTNNFLLLAWNITKLPHRIELAIPKNTIVFVFRFCYILAGK